ncbi:hypothetical protein COV20_04470 [Candidatus Woesearchaeota archaeon CG10_big_fil_rev_8_21_14_0_10_45_16]|nr:MAG: hypothetical protein COV20_04470 [Candidatus Woesearchaeota archaeon CG10_big_fil_rev_8_21_14_0_10_45_16]
MRDAVEKVYELHKKNQIYSAWAQDETIIDMIKDLQSEVEEVREEAEREDWDNFKDEIGDVLWDCLGIIVRAENEGHFTMKEVLEHIHQKFTERKPFLLESRHISKEEENKLWREVKEKQKNARNRS